LERPYASKAHSAEANEQSDQLHQRTRPQSPDGT
jgi:hypothetical protein